MDKKFTPPYLGSAYYPEDWDDSEQEYDIEKMIEAGMSVARIGEFAWHKMEPKIGEYDFEWLHTIVNKLGDAGIAVVMGTPTATPPRWLSKLYPDVFAERENGRRASHGGRRHCCSNNPHYRKYCAKIVEKMGEEFGDDPYIIGWQIDNEIYGANCYCPECMGRFHEYLQEQYGDIENLNKRWNLNLFSQAYDSFDEIPAPRDAWHNPHLQLEWLTFHQNSHIDFVHMQADILHKYTSAPIGTDTMPVNGMDYRRLNSKLDIVQFNHYNEPDNLFNVFLWFDYLRTMIDRPFWNTETSTCWNGSVAIRQSVKPDGFCVANSMIPIALGGEANMYWLWRTHWAGHELVHGSVLDASGRPMHTFGEVQKTADIMAKAADFINDTKVDTDVAFHYTSRNWNMLITQPIVQGMDFKKIYDFYKPVIDNGLRPDLIDAYEDLSKYKLIFSPMMMTLEEGDLQARISEWVKDGGTWVVGPFSDIRDNVGARYKHKPYGILEELTGAKWLYGIPDRDRDIGAAWADGDKFNGGIWYDIFDENGENALVTIADGHSAIMNKACVVHRAVGKGHVIILGTFPGYDELKKIYAIACDYAGVAHGMTDGEVLVAPRKGEAHSGVMLVEYSGRNCGSYSFDGEMVNVVTGEIVKEKIDLKPYDVVILESKYEK